MQKLDPYRRRALELLNKDGDVVKRNVFFNLNQRDAFINTWRKLYGKRFSTLMTRETETPIKKNEKRNRKHL